MITFKHVEKKYPDGFTALKDINFEIQEGELVALIGPSGCGKTTTMRMVNRLTEPTSGQILINGEDISKIDPVQLRRNIGYVIQQIGLLPHMTIEDNITLVPRLKGWDKERYVNKVDELLNMVGLDPETYKSRFPSDLSGGQQQRVGVIRALAAEPPIILMDEPFSALDPISREQLQDELVQLQENIKKTIVFVTHDMDEAIKIADRIAIMKDGEIIQFDTPDRILRHPINEFVRGFIGEERLDAEKNSAPAAEDLMIKKVITARPLKGLAQALKMMKTYKVDSLLVTDHNRFLGIATIEDVEKNYHDEEKTLQDIMRKDFETVNSDTPYTDVAAIFASGAASIPVLSGEKLVGLITKSTMMRGLAGMKTAPGEGGNIHEG
ncbi:osmoprotectant transport system ATP-binding protein [Peribacillus deserti]|uniref:Quaternary amine transport ATP-binding protein n=1 Tax=Peribacillus deserti TaxID=673318 RepID=A0ABS2QJN3_9BACI|nr:betaine/proline/choline family ABC transporter ATP-binding protein [Peribacillus deserti]MBM7693160.1 osmoprotectant transport system ATP-binding protein [Peribacillus deserti]